MGSLIEAIFARLVVKEEAANWHQVFQKHHSERIEIFKCYFKDSLLEITITMITFDPSIICIIVVYYFILNILISDDKR